MISSQRPRPLDHESGHSKYVTLIDLLRQHWLHESVTVLHYIDAAYLVWFFIPPFYISANRLTALCMEESGLTKCCNLILIIGRPIWKRKETCDCKVKILEFQSLLSSLDRRDWLEGGKKTDSLEDEVWSFKRGVKEDPDNSGWWTILEKNVIILLKAGKFSNQNGVPRLKT